MNFAEQAFEACAAKAKALNRRLTRPEWLEAVQGVFDQQAQQKPVKRKETALLGPTRVAPKVAEIDDAWLEELEQNPAYQGVDVRRELGKAQAWAGLRSVGVTRRRFVNWLNRAAAESRPIAINGQGQSSFRRPEPVSDEPRGWQDWVKANSQDPSNALRPWVSLDKAAQDYIRSQLHAATNPR
jgi:hypothetical protein